MLDSISISNYRNLNFLQIDQLRRVNLIIGKNNTGKTSLLEAISLFLHDGSTTWILQLLEERGESIRGADGSKLNLSNNMNILSGLFWGRRPNFNNENGIFISGKKTENKQVNIFDDKFFGEYLSIKIVRYTRNAVLEDGTKLYKKQILDENSMDDTAEIGVAISTGNSYYLFSLEDDTLFRPRSINHSQSNILKDNIQFIRTNNILRETNGSLWDKISLTDKEKYVEDGLRIIENRIERFSFIGEGQSRYFQRNPVVRLKNEDLVIPLRSMGDGINRILTIILAMVNCENGYLLIDEFENGLHYSVQEKLWEIIFHLADKLNIQVFVTTHSNDTIWSFENIVNKRESVPLDGILIKLESVDGIILTSTFEPEELSMITDNLIEVRR